MSEKKDAQHEKLEDSDEDKFYPALNTHCTEVIYPNISQENTSKENEVLLSSSEDLTAYDLLGHTEEAIQKINAAITPRVSNKIEKENVSEIIRNILDQKKTLDSKAARASHQTTTFEDTEIIESETSYLTKLNAIPPKEIRNVERSKEDFTDAGRAIIENLDEIVEDLPPLVQPRAIETENVKKEKSKKGFKGLLSKFCSGSKLWKSRSPLKSSQKRFGSTYKMDNKHRGFALIYNQFVFDNKQKYSDRYGTEKDVERLQKELILAGFKSENIMVYHDFTKLQIYKTVDQLELKYEEELKNCDLIFVFILTHGEKGNLLMAKDRSYDLYEFIEKFTPEVLPQLVTKPKCFFVQACRGTEIDAGVMVRTMGTDHTDGHDSEDDEPYSYPVFADLFIGFSSHHEHYSFRNAEGSWFIQDFCNVLCEVNLEEEHLEDMMLLTKLKVAQRSSDSNQSKFDKKKQIPATYSTLLRKVYLKPKQ